MDRADAHEPGHVPRAQKAQERQQQLQEHVVGGLDGQDEHEQDGGPAMGPCPGGEQDREQRPTLHHHEPVRRDPPGKGQHQVHQRGQDARPDAREEEQPPEVAPAQPPVDVPPPEEEHDQGEDEPEAFGPPMSTNG